MRASLIQLWLRLQASYYFVPTLMVIGAALLAGLTTQLDLAYQEELRERLGWFLGGTAEGARAVLGAIAGSMISVAAVTFSLTMVAVTTAAGQYGPRLISNFMRDRANQITLGTFLATFLYALLVLRNVSAQRDDLDIAGLTPSLSVLVALALTLLSVGVLIHFIHHIPETLNVGTITGKVAHKLRDQIRKGVFPNEPGVEARECGDVDAVFRRDALQTLYTMEPGFVEAVSLKALVEWADAKSLRVRLHCAPGDFLMTGDALLDMVPDDQDAPPDTDNEAEVRAFFAKGDERTEHQNVLFLADELVEIAARALSPGVNDPFTAINCIHWFGEAAQTMMQAAPVPQCVGLPDGTARVWTRSVDFERLMGVLFGQCRQYICEDENAARAAFRALYRLRDHSTTMPRKVIDAHLDDLREAVSQSSLSDASKHRLRSGPPYRY